MDVNRMRASSCGFPNAVSDSSFRILNFLLPSQSTCASFTLHFFVPRHVPNFMSYAIIKTGGKQYRVAEGDVIEVEKLDVEAGAETTFSEVLFLSNGSSFKTAVDLKGATVVAEVIGGKKAPKVICFKYRRRKGYHRTVGHRRKLTELRIKSITA